MRNEIIRRASFTWTLVLIFLLTTQVEDSEGLVSLKFKKLLKKLILLKALRPKKSFTIVPLPIPLSLLTALKDKKLELLMGLGKMPEAMPPMPVFLPNVEKVMPSPHYGMMMGRLEMMPKDMSHEHERIMMASGNYGTNWNN